MKGSKEEIKAIDLRSDYKVNPIGIHNVSSWNELMFAMTFISEPKWKTLTIGLQSLSGMFYTEWGPIGAGMVVATAPVLIIYLLLNRQVQNALIMGAVKG